MEPIIETNEVWAQLYLCEPDQLRVETFLAREFGIRRRSIVRHMHITVYHARRQMPGVTDVSEVASVVIPASETRFMVMAPGGENPRQNLDPAQRKVGIRVHRQSIAMPLIHQYRQRLTQFETEKVLGRRLPSNHRRNAFGARHFQPHMAILRAGSGIDRDLTIIGDRFRSSLESLTFDRFVIESVSRIKTSLKTNKTA